MLEISKAFRKAFSKPDPPAPPMHFADEDAQMFWAVVHKEIGSGWFKTGFLYLFGEELKSLEPCLKAWSFLMPPCKDRMIIGKNAYGALLILDNRGKESESVSVLNPFTVAWETHSQIMFANLIGAYLPTDDMPNFLDHMAYLQWMSENELEQLEFRDMLGPKLPQGLGGKLEPDNFLLLDIVEYHKTRGKIYAEAYAKTKKKGKRS